MTSNQSLICSYDMLSEGCYDWRADGPSGVWASDSWKFVMMTPDEVNRRTHATDVDVKSIMKLGAAGAEAGRSCCCRGMWSSDYSKLVTMTTYEVNDDGDAPGLDVRSVMELDAASSEAGLRC